MAYEPNDLGYVPDANNTAAYSAAMRRLRAGYAQRKAGLAQDLATRGVQTSGVSAIPEAALANQEGAEEAGVIGGLAERQGEQAFQDTELNKRIAADRDSLNQQAGLQQAAARRLAQGQLQAALISGGLGAFGGYLSGLGRARTVAGA